MFETAKGNSILLTMPDGTPFRARIVFDEHCDVCYIPLTSWMSETRADNMAANIVRALNESVDCKCEPLPILE